MEGYWSGRERVWAAVTANFDRSVARIRKAEPVYGNIKLSIDSYLIILRI